VGRKVRVRQDNAVAEPVTAVDEGPERACLGYLVPVVAVPEADPAEAEEEAAVVVVAALSPELAVPRVEGEPKPNAIACSSL
jgi:hypothetical protein